MGTKFSHFPPKSKYQTLTYTSTKPKTFQPTLLPPPVYSGEVSHHMCDSGESDDLSVCHTIKMTSPSVCLSHHLSVSHTTNTTSLSICQSHHSSVCHTTNMSSPSVCKSSHLSVCYTANMTNLSVCQLHESSVCEQRLDSTWNPVCKAVSPSSVPSTLPSAKFMVKMPTSIPVQKFPYMQYQGKLPSISTSMDSSVDPLSITSSQSAEKPLKISNNNGEKHAVNYLHKILVKSPSIHHMVHLSLHLSVHHPYNLSIHHTLSLSLHPSMHCPFHPSIHPSNDKHQELPAKFPGTNLGEKTHPKSQLKSSDNVTLTLQ